MMEVQICRLRALTLIAELGRLLRAPLVGGEAADVGAISAFGRVRGEITFLPRRVQYRSRDRLVEQAALDELAIVSKEADVVVVMVCFDCHMRGLSCNVMSLRLRVPITQLMSVHRRVGTFADC